MPARYYVTAFFFLPRTRGGEKLPFDLVQADGATIGRLHRGRRAEHLPKVAAWEQFAHAAEIGLGPLNDKE